MPRRIDGRTSMVQPGVSVPALPTTPQPKAIQFAVTEHHVVSMNAADDAPSHRAACHPDRWIMKRLHPRALASTSRSTCAAYSS